MPRASVVAGAQSTYVKPFARLIFSPETLMQTRISQIKLNHTMYPVLSRFQVSSFFLSLPPSLSFLFFFAGKDPLNESQTLVTWLASSTWSK